MNKAKKKAWGDEFQRHVSDGRDHADAAYRADEWERRMKAKIKRQHLRGLELAKALAACITAMNPPDRGVIINQGLSP